MISWNKTLHIGGFLVFFGISSSLLGCATSGATGKSDMELRERSFNFLQKIENGWDSVLDGTKSLLIRYEGPKEGVKPASPREKHKLEVAKISADSSLGSDRGTKPAPTPKVAKAPKPAPIVSFDQPDHNLSRPKRSSLSVG